MPSPFSGFTQPAASPISAQFRPATPETAPPMGRSADAGARTGPSMRHSSRRASVYVSSRDFSCTPAGRRAVASVPTPMFTSPAAAPRGNTQP